MENMRQRIKLANSGITTLPHARSTPVTLIFLHLASTRGLSTLTPITTRPAALPMLNELLQATLIDRTGRDQETIIIVNIFFYEI